MSRLVDLTVQTFNDQLADSDGAPGAGSLAAVVGASAAALVVMAARAAAEEWEGARGAAAQAQALRRRLLPLADEDAEALGEALARLDGGAGGDQALGEALGRAAEIPLRIVDACTDVAELAALVADSTQPHFRADAAGAAFLAHAAAHAGAKLVEVNLSTAAGDEGLERAGLLVEACRRAARRAAEAAR